MQWQQRIILQITEWLIIKLCKDFTDIKTALCFFSLSQTENNTVSIKNKSKKKHQHKSLVYKLANSGATIYTETIQEKGKKHSNAQNPNFSFITGHHDI